MLDTTANIDVIAAQLAQRFDIHASKVFWCSNFIAIPGYIPISSLNGLDAALSEYGLFPMDVSSGVAAKLLLMNFIPNNKSVKVLDLCCCPGGKFCMLSDEINDRSSHYQGVSDSAVEKHLVVGVDISKHRLQVCKSVVNKLIMARSGLKNSRVRQLLFEADGTTFGRDNITSIIHDSSLLENELRMDKLKANKLADVRANRRGSGNDQNGVSGYDGDDAQTRNLSTRLPDAPIRKSFANKSARKREAAHLKNVLMYEIEGRTRPLTVRGSGKGKRTWMEVEEAPSDENKKEQSLKSTENIDVVAAINANEVPPLLDLAGFDYVLVDAQCTHDASYRHMNVLPAVELEDSSSSADIADWDRCKGKSGVKGKQQWVKTDNILKSLLEQQDSSAPCMDSATGSCCASTGCHDDVQNIDGDAALLASELRKLQRKLIYRAFELIECSSTRSVEDGGVQCKGDSEHDRCLIYSTCSMKREQNEDVVQWLLDTVNGSSGRGFKIELVPISDKDLSRLGSQTATPPVLVEEKRLTHSLRDSKSGTPVQTVRELLQFSPSDEEFSRLILANMASHDSSLLDPDVACGANPEVASGTTVGTGSINFSPKLSAVHPFLRQVAEDICVGVAGAEVCRPQQSELLPGTVRFNRYFSGTSGLFIAKLRKIKIQ